MAMETSAATVPSDPMAVALPLWPEVFGFAFQLTGDRLRAEELAQEAFSRLVRSRRPLESAAVLRPYLFRIVRNLHHDAARRMKVGSLEEPEQQVADRRGADPLTGLQRLEDREAVRQALLDLKPVWRAVLYLRDALDHSYRDIAEVLGLSEDTVRMTLHRARGRLRERLRDLDGERSDS